MNDLAGRIDGDLFLRTLMVTVGTIIAYVDGELEHTPDKSGSYSKPVCSAICDSTDTSAARLVLMF
jgi:hypothetical protein